MCVCVCVYLSVSASVFHPTNKQSCARLQIQCDKTCSLPSQGLQSGRILPTSDISKLFPCSLYSQSSLERSRIMGRDYKKQRGLTSKEWY